MMLVLKFRIPYSICFVFFFIIICPLPGSSVVTEEDMSDAFHTREMLLRRFQRRP